MAEPKTDELVLAFVRIRDARSELKRAFEARDAELKQQLSQVENELLRRAIEQGVDGFKTENGSTYQSETVHFSITDDDAWTKFLKDENDPSYLERRPAMGRIKEYLEAHGKLPPGLRMFRENHMRVRAKGES